MLKVVNPRKLNLRQKLIILLSRIAILLLKGHFEREKIIFHKKNLKHKKIILLINFIVALAFFLITSYQILKNDAILINSESLFQGKDSLQLNHFQLLKMNQLLSNPAICFWFQPLKNLFSKILLFQFFFRENDLFSFKIALQ